MEDEESSRAPPEFGKVTAAKQTPMTWRERDSLLRSIISFEYIVITSTHIDAVPWALSSEGSVLDRESLLSRGWLLLEQGSSLSWYIKASTAAGTGSCQDTQTHIHKEAIVAQVNSQHFLSADSNSDPPLVKSVHAVLSRPLLKQIQFKQKNAVVFLLRRELIAQGL